MQCHEFDERMQDLLDARRLPEQDPALLAHTSECGNCRQQLAAQEALFRSLAARRVTAVSPGFASRVVEQVQETNLRPQSAPRRPWLLATAIVSTAAAALLAVGIFANHRGSDVQPGGLVRQTPDDQGGQSANTLIAVDTQTKASNSPSPSAVATSQRQPIDGQIAEMVPLEQAIQSLASQVPQAVQRLDEVEEATPGLRPVRKSFTLAIGTIRRTMPQQSRERPPKSSSPRPNKRDSSWVVSEESEPA